MPQQPNVIDIPGVGVIDFGALSPEDTRVAAKRLYDEANVPKQPAALPTKAARAEDFIRPEDRNIFNQDISRSIAEGVGGLYSGGKKMAMGLYDVIADPIKKGYAEGSPAATAEAYLKVPGELLEGATASRLALQDKAKTAKSFPERAAYTVLGKVPFLGPAVAGIGEQLGTGNAETMGEGVFNALASLQASPSFRAMTLKGKAAAIEAIKNQSSRIPVPAPVKSTLGNMLENPGLTLGSAIIGYKEFGAPGAVLGAMGVPSSIGSLRGMFRETPAEIAEKRAYSEGRVKDSRAYAETQTKERNLRQDMNAATKRQETLTDAATKRKETLANAVEKVSSVKERDILLDAQKEARAQVKRENDSIINDRKTARQDELLRNALSEKKATGVEAERIREDRKAIVERHRAEDRDFEVSDTIESNLREDIHIADRTAAQDLRIHEANIKEQARATNLKSAREAANKTKRDIAYSKILTQRQRNALMAESNRATAAKQAELRRGMVGEPPIVRDSTRLKRDGVTTTTNQRFNYPEELAANATPVVSEGQASVVQEAPGLVAPKPRVKKAAIFEEMDARATTEQAGMFPNRMGGRAVELSQDIARDRENRITEWTGEDGKPTDVDPKIAELKRLLDIMSGPESPASVQGRFAQGGTGYFGVNKQ